MGRYRGLKAKLYLNKAVGRSHLKNNEPCQDAVGACSDIRGLLSVYFISDGAGSAKKSHKGSSILCDNILNSVTASVNKEEIKNKKFWVEAINKARDEIESQISATEYSLRDFASTLVAVVVFHQDKTFLCVHIGDGYIFGLLDNNTEILSQQNNVEYANQTRLFTDANFEENLNINQFRTSNYKYLVISSDGLEPILIKHSQPFMPFFQPLTNFLVNQGNSREKKIEAIEQIFFKASKDENLGCYDDLSLVVIEL